MNIMKYQIKGEFTAIRALEIKKDLLDIANKENVLLSIDMTETRKADIGALNAIMMCHNTIKKNSGHLEIIAGRNNPLSELFHLTKFDRLLDIKFLN